MIAVGWGKQHQNDSAMSANVTPEYERAERTFRAASTDEEKLLALREMLRAIPKHKGTEKMQADIKRRISQLRKAQGAKGKTRSVDPFHIPRGGAGQVILVGLPNTGKSSLVAATTRATVKVADYPFTTALPAVGMWEHEDVQIELIDTPPVTATHMATGMMGAVRLADIVCIVVDAAGACLDQVETALEVLAGRGVTVRTAERGELEDGHRSVQCGLIVAARADLAADGDIATLRELYAGRLETWAISSVTGQGLDELFGRLWDLLEVIRVYTKLPGKPPDYDKPFTLSMGSTVCDLARQIHRELPDKMKFARIWGDGRYDGQQVHRTEVLRDKDVVEIHE